MYVAPNMNKIHLQRQGNITNDLLHFAKCPTFIPLDISFKHLDILVFVQIVSPNEVIIILIIS